MMWMLREQRHTGHVAATTESRITELPPLPTPEALAREMERMREWSKIIAYVRYHEDCRQLFATLVSTYPKDTEAHIVKREMLQVINQMEASE